MGSISYKICGDASPFVARLYDSSCVWLCRKDIDYSGTCVVFDGLAGNTCYYTRVTDSINCSTSYIGFTTPSALVPPTLPEKTISVLGTVSEGSSLQIAEFTSDWGSDTVVVDYVATTLDYNITSTSYGWSLTSKPLWVSVLPINGGVGTTNITVSILINRDVTRTGIVRFTQFTTGLVLDLTITQGESGR